MKIMIVDDSRAMRRIVSKTIREAGHKNFEAVEAENGATALEIVRRDPPDLILSDWHMPVMSGLEFKQALDAEGFSIPFGFVTSEGTEAMRQLASEAGANFLLAKPFTSGDMSAVLGAILP